MLVRPRPSTPINNTKASPTEIQRATHSTDEAAVRNLLAQWRANGDKAYKTVSIARGLPYLNVKRSTNNMNCTVKFNAANGAEIECRHFAAYYLNKISKAHKFNFEDINTAESIAKNLLPDLEENCIKILFEHTENYLVENQEWGRFIAAMLEKMATEQKALKKIMIFAPYHAMALVLKTKSDPLSGETHYVANLYDPNRTNTHLRYFTSEIEAFHRPNQTLNAFLSSGDTAQYTPLSHTVGRRFQSYFGTDLSTFVCTICDEDVPGTDKTRTLDTRFSGKAPISEKIGQALIMNYPDILIELGKTETPEALKTAITQDSHRLNYFLYNALLSQYPEAAQAYAKLLKTLPLTPDVLQILLTARSANDIPFLRDAVNENVLDALETYVKVLAEIQLPEPNLSTLLSAYDQDKTPLLYALLSSNKVAAVNTYGRLLRALSPPEKTLAHVLSAKSVDGEELIIKALQAAQNACGQNDALYQKTSRAYHRALAINGYSIKTP